MSNNTIFYIQAPLPLKAEREIGGERKKVRSLFKREQLPNVLMSLFLIYIIHVVIMIMSFRHPAPLKSGERERERERGGCRTS